MSAATYAKILRAAARRRAVRLTAAECMGVSDDHALITAAIGGDSDTSEPPEWLTPTERRRVLAGQFVTVFDPGKRS